MAESLFELFPEAIDAAASVVAATSVVVPVEVAHRVETLAGVPVTVDVLADGSGSADSGSGDLDSVIGFGIAAYGAVGLVGPGVFRYVPQRHFTGVDHFSVTLGDWDGGGDGGRVVWVQVRVWAVNTPPLAASDLVLVDGDGPVTFDVCGNDQDPDGDALRISGYTMPRKGRLTLDAEQRFTYWPGPGFLVPDHSGGHDSFTYSIRDIRQPGDGQVGRAEAQVTLLRPPVVLPPNVPPIAGADRATTAPGTPVTIAILANDLDPDATPDGEPPLRVVALALPRHGLVQLDPDRTVTYTPDPDFTGVDYFTYVIEDGRGGRDDGIVAVEVAA